MYTLILVLLFVGALMVANGIYEQKLQAYQKNTRVEYRFIPRTYYEEQLYNNNLDLKVKDMFTKDAPWLGTDTVDIVS
jgi:hypothetical protein